MRLTDTPDGAEFWLPLEQMGEARLVLTDALIQATKKRAVEVLASRQETGAEAGQNEETTNLERS